MTDTATPALAGEIIPSGLAGQPIRPEVVAAYASMLSSVPDAGGDGMSNILEQIATATDLEDLDAPWRSAGLESYLGRPLRLTGIRKLESDFDGGLPWFLVVDGADLMTGERLTFTTGAVSVVAQLAKAWQLGAFPLDVVPRQADRPSASGYYPQHLELTRVGRGRG